jgi:hypothetical protein
MSFDQMVKELTVFFYQFIEPFLNNEDDISAIHLVIQQLAKIEPGRTKVKQVRFKKKYIKVWQSILHMLCQNRLLRGHIAYLPHIQLLKNINCYIEPDLHQDIFKTSKQLSAVFYIQYFQLRNTAVKEQIMALFQAHTNGAVEVENTHVNRAQTEDDFT